MNTSTSGINANMNATMNQATNPQANTGGAPNAGPEITITSRVSILTPGMWAFRYAGHSARLAVPVVSLNPSCIGDGQADFFPGEGVRKNTLAKPGDSLIVRVQGSPCGILVTEYHLPGEPAGIQLRVDRLDERPAMQASPQSAAQTPTPGPRFNPNLSPNFSPNQGSAGASGAAPLELLGHIERRGDVRARGAWLGDPGSPLRLEGFAVSAEPLPPGLSLAYSCRTPGQAEPQAALAGGFVGSRQKARAITTVAFNIGGAASADYVLGGEVAFAGQPPVPIVPGRELSGPTGTEPLVAIRPEISKRAAVPASPASPWDDPAITAIFRSA